MALNFMTCKNLPTFKSCLSQNCINGCNRFFIQPSVCDILSLTVSSTQDTKSVIDSIQLTVSSTQTCPCNIAMSSWRYSWFVAKN